MDKMERTSAVAVMLWSIMWKSQLSEAKSCDFNRCYFWILWHSLNPNRWKPSNMFFLFKWSHDCCSTPFLRSLKIQWITASVYDWLRYLGEVKVFWRDSLQQPDRPVASSAAHMMALDFWKILFRLSFWLSWWVQIEHHYYLNKAIINQEHFFFLVCRSLCWP